MHTKERFFYNADTVYFQTNTIINDSTQKLSLKKFQKGIGYIKRDRLTQKPIDFSMKNYLPITSLYSLMKQLLFLELYPKSQQFHLTEEDQLFLINTMKTLPKDASYDSNEYYDSYVKFFLFGDGKDAMLNHIEIHNKVAYAYGYLTDCAYIVNKRTTKNISLRLHCM